MKLAFVDIETTGLDPEEHEPWEIAVIIDNGEHASERVFYPHLEHLGRASATALKIGGYYSRRKVGHGWFAWGGRQSGDDYYVGPGFQVAVTLAPMLNDAILVGCTVHFDAAFLESFLRRHNQAPAWDYHLLDATVYAAGAIGLAPPWKSTTVSGEYGPALTSVAQRYNIDLSGDPHTALHDARQARLLYYAAQDLRDGLITVE